MKKNVKLLLIFIFRFQLEFRKKIFDITIKTFK